MPGLIFNHVYRTICTPHLSCTARALCMENFVENIDCDYDGCGPLGNELNPLNGAVSWHVSASVALPGEDQVSNFPTCYASDTSDGRWTKSITLFSGRREINRSGSNRQQRARAR